MRTTKYRDYIALRILLYIALVILGLFIFMKFVKPALDHKATDEGWIEVKATCTTDGYRYKECEKCGKQFDRETLYATGHTLDKLVIDVEPTCDTAGKCHNECKVCHEKYGEETIPALGHNFSEFIKKPTCTADGHRYNICDNCGKETDKEILNATGHTLGDLIIDTEATCTTEGASHKVCKTCGENYGAETIPAMGHTDLAPVKENEKDHSRTEGGSFESVIYCEVCNAEVSRETVMVDGAHSVEIEQRQENYVAPDCYTKESYDLVDVCKGCNHVFEETRTHYEESVKHGSALPPKYEHGKDATCTEPGSFALVEYCSICNAELGRSTQVINPNGHEFAWGLTLNNDEVIIIGICTRDDCDHTYDPSTDTEYTYEIVKDEESSVPDCVEGDKIFVATVYKNGEKIKEVSITVTKPIKSHTIITEESTHVEVAQFELFDENGESYYNVSTFGMNLIFTKADGQTTTEAIEAAWDEDGYAIAVYRCAACDTWRQVRVYNDLAE